MPTAAWIVIGIFAFGVIAGLVTRMVWAISTQHRDHGVAATDGPVIRRRIWARHPPAPHAGPVNPEAIPGATDGQGEAPSGTGARTERPAQQV